METASHVSWLIEGDKNTRFFHSYASERRRVNQITSLVDVHGRIVREEADIVRKALDYFANLFTAQQTTTSLLQDLVQPWTISSQIQQSMDCPYTEEELISALQEMHPTKASGPDGLSTGFYQKIWPQVKREVI